MSYPDKAVFSQKQIWPSSRRVFQFAISSSYKNKTWNCKIVLLGQVHYNSIEKILKVKRRMHGRIWFRDMNLLSKLESNRNWGFYFNLFLETKISSFSYFSKTEFFRTYRYIDKVIANSTFFSIRYSYSLSFCVFSL